MKKIIKILAAIFLVVVFFYISRFIYRANTGQLVSNRGDVEILNWKEFVSPSGDFKVLFAVEPRHKNSDYENVKRDAYRAVNKDIGYAVNVAKYPFERPIKQDEVQKTIEASLEANLLTGQKIVSKNITNFSKYPALDYVTKTIIDGANIASEKGKIILVQGEKHFILYFLSVIYKDSLDDKSYNTFINSFEIIKTGQ